MATEEAKLIFIPIPGMGHLPSMVELARKLVSQYPDQVTITILLMSLPYPDNKISTYIKSLKSDVSPSAADSGRISFINLPPPEKSTGTDSKGFLTVYMESYKPIIKQTLLDNADPRRPLGGIIVDMFCTAMIDVANDLGIPAYIYFASGAALLRLMLHFESTGVPDVTKGEYSAGELDETKTEVAVAVDVDGFRNPVPLKVWPDILLDKDGGGAELFLGNARRFRESKGILVNTFAELEPDLLRSLATSQNYPVYPVGPLLNLKDDAVNDSEQKKSIVGWLDLQPASSVVFLCFGSRGTFHEAQFKEIAAGLEQSGYRFLWSLRRNPLSSGGALESPEEYEDLAEVLPEGFLQRTEGKGRVIGWAPQASVLGHRAVGAFVSHCGWNSMLEAMWFGVPVGTWPMYFEQQLNAFLMVKEMAMAVEIRMDYRYDFGCGKGSMVVKREEIVGGLRKVMEEEGREVREKVKRISEMGKMGLEIGGSSFDVLGRFVKDVFKNISG